jgi:hypothetical protein
MLAVLLICRRSIDAPSAEDGAKKGRYLGSEISDTLLQDHYDE